MVARGCPVETRAPVRQRRRDNPGLQRRAMRRGFGPEPAGQSVYRQGHRRERRIDRQDCGDPRPAQGRSYAHRRDPSGEHRQGWRADGRGPAVEREVRVPDRRGHAAAARRRRPWPHDRRNGTRCRCGRRNPFFQPDRSRLAAAHPGHGEDADDRDQADLPANPRRLAVHHLGRLRPLPSFRAAAGAVLRSDEGGGSRSHLVAGRAGFQNPPDQPLRRLFAGVQFAEVRVASLAPLDRRLRGMHAAA